MSQLIETLLDKLDARAYDFAAGQMLFHTGDAVRQMYIVTRGVIHLARYQADGSVLILQRAKQGQILAEASVYSRQYHCDARAETDAQALMVSRDDMRDLLAKDAELSEGWANYLALEVQRTRRHAEILSLKTVAERLNAWVGWNGALPDKGKRRLLALEIGVSPEALYREIAKKNA